MQIRFIIPGNQDNSDGNAIPKLKMTGKQSWTPKAQRYKYWKQFVQDKFIEVLHTYYPELEQSALQNMVLHGKPIGAVSRPRMDLLISWKDGKHPDPENVFGSIADALFVNDKHLAGSFDFVGVTGQGLVRVTLEL